MEHLPIYDVVGKQTAVAWAAVGAQFLEFDGWWILRGHMFTSCGVYGELYPALYASKATRYELPKILTTDNVSEKSQKDLKTTEE